MGMHAACWRHVSRPEDSLAWLQREKAADAGRGKPSVHMMRDDTSLSVAKIQKE